MSSSKTLVGIAALVLIGFVAWFLKPQPPSLSSDAFQLVMSTYNATRAEDVERITRIEDQLNQMSLAPNEQETILELLQQARSGQWREAADESFELMQAQRRTP